MLSNAPIVARGEVNRVGLDGDGTRDGVVLAVKVLGAREAGEGGGGGEEELGIVHVWSGAGDGWRSCDEAGGQSE